MASVVHVLIELRREEDYVQAETIWNLICKVYLATLEFEGMDGDKRKTYAANLTVEACNHLQDLRRRAGLMTQEKPPFVTAFEEHLAPISQSQQGQQGRKRRRESAASSSLQTSEGPSNLSTSWTGDLESLPGMSMNFEEFDWLIGLPGEYQLFADLEQPVNFGSSEL